MHTTIIMMLTVVITVTTCSDYCNSVVKSWLDQGKSGLNTVKNPMTQQIKHLRSTSLMAAETGHPCRLLIWPQEIH